MNHFTFSALLTSILSFVACLYALQNTHDNKRVSRIFALYWFSIAFWSSTVGFQRFLLARIDENVWGWFLHFGVLFIPTLFLHFSVKLTQTTAKNRGVLFVAYSLTFLYLFLNSFTKIFTKEIAHRDAYAYPTPALLYPVYFGSFVVFIVWGTILILKFLPSVPAGKRGSIGIFLLFHCLAYLGGMDNFAIMWDIRIFPFYPFGLYAVPLYACASIYALKKNAFSTDLTTPATSNLSPSLG